MNESTAWLTWLYGPEPLGLIWIGGQQDNFVGRTFTSIDEAAAYADTFITGGVYHRLTTLRTIERGRGTAGDSAYLPGFAMDLDLKGPGHKALNYPETDDDLTTLLRKAGLPEPSAWVHSGGGRYPFWKLDQPADLTIPGALDRAATISARLHKHVITWAGELGWKVDNTSDLARVYRLPGTMNRKTDTPVMCTVIRQGELRHSLDALEHALNVAPSPVALNDSPMGPAGSSPFAQPSELNAFAGLAGTGARPFTKPQAYDYIWPALSALETAVDGEINNKLLAAAMTLAHFGPEFWSRDFAEQQLMVALSKTVYDGMTWQAPETIERAYRDMVNKSGPAYWHATLIHEAPTAADAAAVFGDMADQPMELPASPEAAADAVEAMLSRMLTAEQMCLKPPPEPLIWDLLDRDTIAALIGQPGSFKSFVALDMAGHVATGRPWRKRQVHQGEVVYIAAEGERGMTLRIRAWQSKYGPMTGVRFLPEPVQIKDPVAWRVLIEACRRIQPVMVVVDTQAMVSVGMEENSNTEMSVVIDAFKAIKRATGACVLVVHHTTKAGDSTRGASAQDGAQDTRLKLERANPRSSMVVKMIEGKQKDMAEGDDGGEPMMLETVELGTDAVTGRRLSSLVLSDANAFTLTEGNAVIAPEDEWEAPVESVRELALRVLADHGEDRGVTSSDARLIVIERWYGGVSARLSRATWRSSWNRAIKDERVVNVGGERFTLDRLSETP